MSNAKSESISKTAIVLDMIEGKPFTAGEFQKDGTLTAQLRQTVTKTSEYESKRVSNNLNGGLFDAGEFGFEPQVFTSSEERVAWIMVPEDMTLEVFNKRLEAANKAGAVIYRVLSNEPILSEDQKWSIQTGRKTKDDYANGQVVRHPDTGKLIADSNGNVMYRKTFFWPSHKSDMDMRGDSEVYMSEEIKQEIDAEAGELHGQEAE